MVTVRENQEEVPAQLSKDISADFPCQKWLISQQRFDEIKLQAEAKDEQARALQDELAQCQNKIIIQQEIEAFKQAQVFKIPIAFHALKSIQFVNLD